ncbi:MAG: hypothetical protein P1P93_00595 [Gammaproteobacteria bacterium]|nr:hypothetical protein [Gammaproteobacteria bacterium]
MKRNLVFSVATLLCSSHSWAGGGITPAIGQNANFMNPAMMQPTSPPIMRDPFSPSTAMFEALNNRAVGQNQFGFMRNQGAQTIPKMRLKGFIDKGENSIALLEIVGSGTYMVREGDEINIDPRQPYNAIRISEINRLSITVESGFLGAIKVLR